MRPILAVVGVAIVLVGGGAAHQHAARSPTPVPPATPTTVAALNGCVRHGDGTLIPGAVPDAVVAGVHHAHRRDVAEPLVGGRLLAADLRGDVGGGDVGLGLGREAGPGNAVEATTC